MKSYSEISNKYMKENKKRSIMTIFGITLAALLVFAIGTFLYSLKDSTLKYERSRGDFEFVLSNLSNSQAEKIMNNVEIKNSSLCEDPIEYTVENTDKIVSLANSNKNYYSKIFTNKLLKGNLPKKPGEVLLNSLGKEKLNVNVGDKISLVDKNGKKSEVIVSGISEIKSYSSNSSIMIEGYLGSTLNKENKYSLFVNLKSDKNKQDIIKNVMNKAGVEITADTKEDNQEILYLTGNGGDTIVTNSIRNIVIFVLAVIIISTVTVIYNSFNISVIERIRYFGILKAIGATNNQIKKIIYKEGFLMGLIAMPLGCIIGFLALKFGVKIFISGKFMMMNLHIGFYPIVILLTAAIVFLTVFLSLIIPVRKVKKVSAVEAMRNSKEIRIGKIKKRKNRVIGKMFGVEGSMAYKNIRRTPARFFITLIALTLSLVMFNLFYSMMDFSRQFINQYSMDMPFDAQVNKTDSSMFSDDELNKYANLKYANQSYKYYFEDISTLIDKKYLVDKPNKGDVGENFGYGNFSNDITVGEGQKELNYYNKYIIEGSIDYNKLDNGGVILIDGYKITDKDNKKKIERITNYKVGDKIKVTKLPDTPNLDKNSLDKAVKESYEATVVAIVNKEVLKGSYLNNNEFDLAFTKKGYESLTNNKVNYNSVTYKFNNKNKENQAIRYFDKIANDNNLSYYDIKDSLTQANSIFKQIEFFVYCFIIIITVIAIVNIFNTISTNLLIRKKEFATLKAIGMTERQLTKNVILEGTLYGIISALVGGVASFILSNVFLNMGGGLVDAEYHFNYIVFTISMLAAVLVTYLATILPLKRLNKLTIIEGIRDED